ncbi:uncharacterized protein LOC136074136 [Hydra vulgaris]|uniref:Uncharacterized protein LOC136074136 n=1 Tax=Hydra vulgaris TaxID=6087 RepID=A0ABM4B147_HYDVU
MDQPFTHLKNDETTVFSKAFKLKFSDSVGVNWRTLGRWLNIEENHLDMIDKDNSKSDEKAYSMFNKWLQTNDNPTIDELKTALKVMNRMDLIRKVEELTNYNFSHKNVSTIECRIPHGCVFKFDLKDEFCREVEFQLCSDSNNWKVINYKKNNSEYYLTKRKNGKLFVKVENLLFENEKINFKFSFQDSKEKSFQNDCSVIITGIFNFELHYNGLFIATPEPVFDNEFSENIKTLKSLDWREINKICLKNVPVDKPIELIALDYFNRNFPDYNDVIHVSSSIANNENVDFVVSKFIGLFTVNKTSLRAVLPGYRLRYHASLLKCNVENFTYYNEENRVMIFFCKLNLVIIAHVATSTDNLKLEYKSCLNDVILFVNVNNPLIHNNKLIILGIVVLPLHDRKDLKEELFFHFSESFDLDQVLFLCKDDMEDESFIRWWRSVAEYCIKKVNPQNNEELFKKIISLTMILMTKVDHCYPTLESDTQKQIQTLLLNYEQRNAINDKALKKIITGGYGSGKSIVGKEIVKNCIAKKSENPITLYYICCNHFSLYECQMKEFVEGIEKTSNVEIVCDNLYNLWKIMCQNKNILNTNISLPKLLEYLARSEDNKVSFVLEELSEEYVKEKDAAKIKHLFTSILKESLVVFIPESVTKNRELVTNKRKRTLQKNFFQEEVIGMKVISLNKSMRVTEYNKLIIDIAQKTICETKSVLNIPKQSLRILQENKKNNLIEGEDLQIAEKEDLIFFSKNYSQNITTISVKNYEKDDKKSNDTSHFDLNDTVKVIKDNNFPSVENIKDFKSDQSSERVENKFIDTNDFYDFDLDHMAKKITKSTINVDPNNYMETEYVFKSGIIGHSIKGEKPKVVHLPFDDITNKQSVKLLSIMLEKLCFNVLRKTVVICSNMEEVQSIAYAIDIIGNFEAVTYSPHLQQISPSLETKIAVKKKLTNDMNILVTDCKDFSGEESASVILFVNPEEVFLRHLLVDAISRSNSNLIVFVKKCEGNNEPLDKDKTIGNVLINWSEEFVEKITIATSNAENRKSMDVFFVINENCKVFIDRGSTNDFEEYKKKSQFKIFHENNSIYETIFSELSNQVKQEFKKGMNKLASTLNKVALQQVVETLRKHLSDLFVTSDFSDSSKSQESKELLVYCKDVEGLRNILVQIIRN